MSDDGLSADRSSPPVVPPDSPGSSVSARMQEEYTELLRFVVSSELQRSHLQSQDEAANGIDAIFNQISLVSKSEEDEASPANVTVVHQPRLPSEDDNEEEEGNTNSNNNIDVEASDNKSQEEADLTQNRSCYSPRAEGESAYNLDSNVCVGPGVQEMGEKLDIWLGSLKGDILAELTRSLVRSQEDQKKRHEQSVADLVTGKQRLEREATLLCEQVAACEQSLKRKDTLVNNLTEALAASKEKIRLAKCFYNQRAECEDAKRLSFTEKLAAKHHHRQLIQRVMRAWFGLIQTRWRNRVQKSCEEHARNVCGQLSQDYEDKIKQLNGSIDVLQQKVTFLQQERGQYAEQVRKAFMRGVCALNMETMSAFGQEDNVDLDPATGHSRPTTIPTGPACYQEAGGPEEIEDFSNNASMTQTLSHSGKLLGEGDRDVNRMMLTTQNLTNQLRSIPAAEVSYTTGVIESGTVGVVTTTRSAHSSNKTTKSKPATKGKAGRPVSGVSSAPTRHSAHPGGVSSQGQPLAPPMASVVVERHNPVTKQTLGKATAVRYPKSAMGLVSKSMPGQTFKPLAGQSVASSIKVVD